MLAQFIVERYFIDIFFKKSVPLSADRKLIGTNLRRRFSNEYIIRSRARAIWSSDASQIFIHWNGCFFTYFPIQLHVGTLYVQSITCRSSGENWNWSLNIQHFQTSEDFLKQPFQWGLSLGTMEEIIGTGLKSFIF